MTLLARIKVHSQQICGLAWSSNGRQFATGSNDNLCCLFNVDAILGPEVETSADPNPQDGPSIIAEQTEPDSPDSPETPPLSAFSPTDSSPPSSTSTGLPTSVSGDGTVFSFLGEPPSPCDSQSLVRKLPAGSERHRWQHAAAVKAIAFCPWREGLVATGGGSNDKCIHFYHTTSGAALATISVSAQVTSLIWSTTRREIAATFGYAQPDHPYRIAEGEHRALYAIAYPGGPNDTYRTSERRRSRTAEEGCIIVASSDESVKFHEVWMAERKATTLGSGVLGGSDILEMGEGIDKEGDVIR
ncbi:WD40 repeat-like protein [Xylariaceae sp. FL0016]|nr:WD40 repeat-like protein [Xylariaceae sp. FL0016]